MKCGSCGGTTPAGAMYCEDCGSALETREVASGVQQMGDPDVRSGKFSQPPVMRLVVLRGGSKGRIFPLEEGKNLIGRWDPDANAYPDIDLEAEDVEAKVSRRHAVIERTGYEATLEDIGSLNGTFLNRGNRLEQGKVVKLTPADEVIVGKTFLRFEVDIPVEKKG